MEGGGLKCTFPRFLLNDPLSCCLERNQRNESQLPSMLNFLKQEENKVVCQQYFPNFYSMMSNTIKV